MSHHATEDLAILRSIPELTVVSPCGYWETEQVTNAILNIKGPFYLRLDKSAGDDAPAEEEVFRIGQARTLQEGKDWTFIVTGGILGEVQAAAFMLREKGLSVGIMSIHTIKPIDEAAIMDAAKNSTTLITVEEHSVIGGLGGAVAEALMENDVRPTKFARIDLDAGFSSIVGSQEYLRAAYKMDAESIAVKALSLFEESATAEA